MFNATWKHPMGIVHLTDGVKYSARLNKSGMMARPYRSWSAEA